MERCSKFRPILYGESLATDTTPDAYLIAAGFADFAAVEQNRPGFFFWHQPPIYAEYLFNSAIMCKKYS